MSLPDTVLSAGARVAGAAHAAADAAEVLGPEAGFWNDLRRAVLPAVDTLSGGVVDAARPAVDDRYAGTLSMPEREAGELLAASGFERNPFASLKLRDGDPEVGSWVLRDDTGDRQVHAVLFDGGEGTDVYVHEEYSSLDPDVAPAHYRGHGVDDEYGVAFARALYPAVLGVEEGATADRGPDRSPRGDDGLVASLSPPEDPRPGAGRGPGARVVTDGGAERTDG